jgi:hypothetical protein
MTTGVEFEEDKLSYGNPSRSRPSGAPTFSGYHQTIPADNEPRMIRWLMKKGIVKSTHMAQGLLVALVIINIIITYVVIKYFL